MPHAQRTLKPSETNWQLVDTYLVQFEEDGTVRMAHAFHAQPPASGSLVLYSDEIIFDPDRDMALEIESIAKSLILDEEVVLAMLKEAQLVQADFTLPGAEEE